MFTLNETKTMSETLPRFTNILISFNKDTTFTIEDREFHANGFTQDEPIKIVKLTLENSFWNISLYDILMYVIGFAVTSIAIAIISYFGIKYKRKRESRLVRVNRSRVYFDPSMHDTAL